MSHPFPLRPYTQARSEMIPAFRALLYHLFLLALTALGSQSASAQPCPFGKFSATGNAPCTDCAPGSYGASTGLTVCPACSPGTFSADPGTSACLNCGIGTFALNPGQSACTSCAAGTFGSGTGQTACANCAAGTFSSTTGRSLCQNCQPGTFAANAGQSACANCPAGSFGAFAAATSCADCPAGSFAASTGMSACTSCQAGTFAAVTGQSVCTNCPAGSFGAATGSTACAECAAGTFASETGVTVCTNCEAGTFAPSQGSAACTSCPAGTFQALTGAATCDDCSGSMFSFDDGSATCPSCAALSTNGAVKVAFSGIGSATDRKAGSVSVDASILLSAAEYAQFDPLTDGIRLVLEKPSELRLFDTEISGGAPTAGHNAGWTLKTRKRGVLKEWSYKDRTGSPIDGITGVKIAARFDKRSGTYRVAIGIDGADSQLVLAAADVPLKLVLGFGASRGTPCGIHQYAARSCSFSSHANKLKCKVG